MAKLIIRHDDFDFRMDAQDYIDIHEKFIEAGLTETAVLQFTQDGHVKDFDGKLISYMRTAPNWDFQLHGWQHEKYSEWAYDDIIRDMAAAKYLCYQMFGRMPTHWFTPWNCYSEVLQNAAENLHLIVHNESYDIAKFIREIEANTYDGESLYFHGWNENEMKYFPRMIELAKKYESR